MTRTTQISIITLVALILLSGGLVGWYYWSHRTTTVLSPANTVNNAPVTNTTTPPDTTNGNVNTPATNTDGTNANNSNVTPATTNTNTSTAPVAAQTDSATIQRLARIFVERYGTFSNKNNFENITNLEPFMTEAFKKQSLKYIDAHQSADQPAEYYGITTTVVALEVTTVTAGQSAQVHLDTQRLESKGNIPPKTFTQGAAVNFEYVSGQWKVASVIWQ